jgi:hypothetical protein
MLVNNSDQLSGRDAVGYDRQCRAGVWRAGFPERQSNPAGIDESKRAQMRFLKSAHSYILILSFEGSEILAGHWECGGEKQTRT